MSINQRCFICRKDIDSSTEEYYVFVSKTSTENEPYCTKCYLQEMENAKELDPFVFPLYSRNFIKMNKDD